MAKTIGWTPKRFKTLMARGMETETIIKQLETVFKGFPVRLTADDVPKLEIMRAMVGDDNAPNNPYTQLITAIHNFKEVLIFTEDIPIE